MRLQVNFIVFVSYFICSVIGCCCSLTIPGWDSLRLRILEFDAESGRLVQVLTSRNSDIIYGEHVTEGNVIVIECRSSYGPMTVAYKGDGAPEYDISTNTTNTSNGLYFWSFVSFSRMAPQDTGNYSCVSVNDPSLRNSLHLYVPGVREVFVPTKIENRLEYPTGNVFRIPCSVTHPRARVSLERSPEYLSTNRLPGISYSPKTGFSIPVSMVGSRGATVLLCKATFRGQNDQAEYKIFSEIPTTLDIDDTEEFSLPDPSPTSEKSENLRSACSPHICGKNAECIVVEYAAHCVCFENYTGDPFTACHLQKYQQYSSRDHDPCKPNPCSAGVKCLPVNGHPVCTCDEGNPILCKHKPQDHQSANLLDGKRQNVCMNSGHCELNEYCNRKTSTCDRVCHGTFSPYCGANSICIPKNHSFTCQCLPGYENGSPYLIRAPGGCFKNIISRPDHERDLCDRTRCGVGTKCQVQNGNVSCVRTKVPEEVFDAQKACDRCGPNSVCTVQSDRLLCQCAENAFGVPPNCTHSSQRFCRDSFDCPEDKICDGAHQCKDPCSWSCSATADCKVVNHIMKCLCPPGYEGDPHFECRKMDPEPTTPHPCRINCGPNTICRSVMFGELEKYRNTLRKSRHEALFFDMLKANGNAKQGVYSECLCRMGYQGNPYGLGGCQISQHGNGYPATIVMEPNPCDNSPCGKNSFCRSYNGKAFCSCDLHSSGLPPNCKVNCKADSHCMFGESCIQGLCRSIK